MDHAFEKFFVAPDTSDEFREGCSRLRRRHGRCLESGLCTRRGRENKIQVLKAKRFPQDLVESCLFPATRVFGRGVAGGSDEKDALHFSMFNYTNRPGYFVARHSGHFLIQEDDIERPQAECTKRLLATLCENHLVAVAL